MKLIWIEDARVKNGWSAHLAEEPDTTLFVAQRDGYAFKLTGAFVPDSHEQSRGYVNLVTAKQAAELYLSSWIERRGLIAAERRSLAVGDVVRCYEDPVTEQEIEGDCLLMSKVGAGDDGREMWRVRFAADGIVGPHYTRSVHVRNRYNNADASEEGAES